MISVDGPECSKARKQKTTGGKRWRWRHDRDRQKGHPAGLPESDVRRSDLVGAKESDAIVGCASDWSHQNVLSA